MSVSGDMLEMVVIASPRPTTLRAVPVAALCARVNPFARAVVPLFAFPDRHVGLEGIDQPLAGGERIGTVGGADGDRDARLLWRHFAEPMHDHAFYHRPAT